MENALRGREIPVDGKYSIESCDLLNRIKILRISSSGY